MSVQTAVYTGVFPVVPTIFHQDGRLDLEGQKRCLDFMIDTGVQGLCILANYSEQFLLSDSDREQLTKLTLEHVNGRVPVIVTTSHYSTAICAERSRQAQTMGAAMVMILPPYHGATIRVSTEDVYHFYQAVSDAINIPIMVQDAPIADTPMPSAFLARMAREIENVCYFKIETGVVPTKLRELIQLGGDSIVGPWDGLEGTTLLPDLDAGATGAMTGGGYPDGILSVVKPYFAGDRDSAVKAYDRWLPLINYENRVSGILTAKILMHAGGIIASDASRHPFASVQPHVREGLLEIARRLEPLVLHWAQ